jgi:tRNA(Ile)-lysidine synthase
VTTLTDAAFAQAMARLGPFESNPDLAVAVSGGADSMALALLADTWARARGGRVTALTVDHGLRRESAAEARQVARWLKTAGIRHRTLRWSPPQTPRDKGGEGARMANLQAAARDARYDLLCGWCREHAVLHLLLAHHQDDQAETLLLRLARGSGLDGLAAMSPLTERATVRLLRPLLRSSKNQLVGYLEAHGQSWIDDPSNRDPANARVRMRQLLPRLAEEGMTITRLAETAERLAQARAVVEGATNQLLAHAVALYPEGYLRLDTVALRCAEREVGLRALARAIGCVGGAIYGPRLARLNRLYEQICRHAEGGPTLGRGRTLGGCRIVPKAGRSMEMSPAELFILREPAAVSPPLSLNHEVPVIWDGRYEVAPEYQDRRTAAVPRTGVRKAASVWTIGALGEAGWHELRRSGFALEHGLPPRDVIFTLPALRRRGKLMTVPHLGYQRAQPNMGKDINAAAWQVRFAPLSPLTKAGFTLV